MQDKTRLIAIIGASGSGKSALAHKFALKHQCAIFSLDSLSIYKEIDIASAKPSVTKRKEVRYYAIDELFANELSNAIIFRDLLTSALEDNAIKHPQKPLLIVGGSSFFLKSIIDGLSYMPTITQIAKDKLAEFSDISACYKALQKIDSISANAIKPTDTYRIHRALLMYFSTGVPPSAYFATNPKRAFPHKISIYHLVCDVNQLRLRIAERTRKMLENGLIDEIAYIAKTYGEDVRPLRAIGPKETMCYLRGDIDRLTLEKLINTHTCQLAKRQRTFNKTQFEDISPLEANALEDTLEAILSKCYDPFNP